MQYKNTTKKAFTLIELLIVIAILSTLSTIMLVDFGGSRTNQELDEAAREVASAFREAQNYALTGYQGVSNTIPCRYDVSWANTAYLLTYFYKNGAGVCNQSAVVRTYTLRKGIAFTGAGNFSFSPPHAVVSFAAVSVPVTVSKAGISYTVCTYNSGLINHTAGNACP